MATASHILQNLKYMCRVVLLCNSTCCGSVSETDPVIAEDDNDTGDSHTNEKQRLLTSYGSVPSPQSGESSRGQVLARVPNDRPLVR
jgi:hypothetical protein